MLRLFLSVFGQIVWLFWLFHWSLPRLINERAIEKWKANGRATFYQFTEAIYLWPLIVVGAYTLLLDWLDWMPPSVLGWIYMVTLALVLTTLVIDIKRGMMVAVVLGIAFLLIGAAYVEQLWGWGISVRLSRFVQFLKIDYPRGIVIFMTIVSGALFGVNFFWRTFDSTITVEGDQLTLKLFAGDDQTFQRGGWSFRARFKDLLEWLFGGGSGSLAICNPVNGQELFVAHHVPGFKKIASNIQVQFATTDVTPKPNQPTNPPQPPAGAVN